jgi:hypothetical protein
MQCRKTTVEHKGDGGDKQARSMNEIRLTIKITSNILSRRRHEHYRNAKTRP